MSQRYFRGAGLQKIDSDILPAGEKRVLSAFVIQGCSLRLHTRILLRINRSIQAEGVFAMIKEDMNFRRFLTRGNRTVKKQWHLAGMAYNRWKLHHKIQTGQLGNHLFAQGAA